MIDHLVPLACEGWSLWRWIRLRGAGFAANGVLRLAAPDTASLIDRALNDEAILQQLAEDLCRRLEATAETKEQRRALKKLRAGTISAADELGPDADPLRKAASSLEELRSAIASSFAREGVQIGEYLHTVAKSPLFREAITWQNRRVVSEGLDPFLARPPGATDSRTRKKELAIASYLQRYSTKNDTIGFFGPVGWGTISPIDGELLARPGPQLVSKRKVYFEHWAIEALAAGLADSSAVRPHLCPRLMPSIRIEGSILHYGADKTAELPPQMAQILSLCDGSRAAREVAGLVIEDFESEDEVYETLEELESQRLISWTMEIPTGIFEPEKELRRQILSIEAPEARSPALEKLDAIERAKTQVAEAAGDAARLDAALRDLESTFEAQASTSATRRGGQTYAGRSLVYEDCVRDVDFRISPAFFQRVAPVLTLLFQSARWFTHAIAAAYREVLTLEYRKMVSESSSGVVDYLRYWPRVADYFGDRNRPAPELVQKIVAELHDRWGRVVRCDPAASRVSFTAAELRERAAELFAAPHPGWPTARFHSPDLLISAPSTAAVDQGDFYLVVGEIHVALNTLLSPCAVVHCPEFDALLRAKETDIRIPTIAPVESSANSSRADNQSLCPGDFHLELGATRSWRPRARVLRVADLVVEELPSGIVVRSRDGTASFDLIHFFDQYLTFAAAPHFTLFGRAAHFPRITIDRVIIQRERWRFKPEEITFAAEENPLQRFIAARRWARSHQLPRWVFVKIPEEPKPYYLDFMSPAYTELFARQVRKASAVSMSEMAPTLENTWLQDAAGRNYTSELRINAVDPQPWRAF